MALAGEVGELVEIFQWLTTDESAAVMFSPVSRRPGHAEATESFIEALGRPMKVARLKRP